MTARTRPARTLLALEVRLLWRYGVVALAAALAAAWTGLLAALPDPAARVAAPWLLLLETALFGSTLAGALVQLERGQGVRAVRAVLPARTGAQLAARTGLLAGLSVVVAMPVALAGRPTGPVGLLPVLAGVGLTAGLTILLGVAVAARCRSVVGLLAALPLVFLPLLVPAVAHGAGLRHPGWYASPVTGALALIQSGYGATAPVPAALLAWLGAGCAGAGWLAVRVLRRAGAAPGAGPDARPARVPATARVPGGPVRAFLRTDLANLRRDPLLLLVVASPVLLGLAARAGYPPVQDWLGRAYGFDLDPYRPVLLAAAVLLHVPVTAGMAGALLVLDDVDDRALVALRVSPLTLPRYLGYRTGLATAAALAGLAVAIPLSGLMPPGSGPALLPAALLAGLVAPATMLATLAVARNKLAGVATLKLLGLPLYAPLAGWWLAGPGGWPLALLPTWWVLQAAWVGWLRPAGSPDPGGWLPPAGWSYLAGGAVLLVAAVALLARRALHRLAAAAS